MVVKEDIVDWFKRQHSHQRLDVLCSLFDFCLPFELRFAANCIDVLVKRDTFAYPDNEVVSSLEKNTAGWDPGAANLGEESLRRKLIFTLAHNPANRILVRTVSKFLCSTSALQYLKLLDGNRKPPVPCSTTDWTSTYHEVLLIYTMAMYHPGFTLEERVELERRYVFLKDLPASVEQMSLLGMSANKQSPSQNSKPSHSQSSSQPSEDKQPSPVLGDENSAGKEQQNSSPSKKFSNQHRFGNGRRATRNFSNSTYENNVNWKRSEAANGDAHRNSNCSNCNNADYLTPQLRDQMGPERFRKFWKKLEQYSLSQLRALSDEQLHEIGLTPPLIARLRKVLRSNLNLSQPSKSSTNGVCSPSSADRTEKSKSETSHEESANPRQQQPSPVNSTAVPSSTMIKSLTGPPNVLPPFSSSSSANSQQHPPSRAESLCSSSSSMETPSPPASRSSSPSGKGGRRRAADQQQRMPPSRPAPLPTNPPAGLRPRLPFSGSLNLPYVRPSSTANALAVNTVRPQHQQPSNSRGASQPRDLPLNAMTVPSQASASYMLTNTTPPPNLEMPPIPMYHCHGYVSVGGTGSGETVSGLVPTQPYAQPPFPYMTTATTPGTPISSPYATSYYLHNPILAQSVAPPPSGSSTNGRPVEYPAFVPQGPILYPRPIFDFSRHPPPGTPQPSCYNCGASGHRGNECREFSPEDVIRLASA